MSALNNAQSLRIHFLGIAGIGMSALAQVLLDQGHAISGTDPQTSPATDRLQRAGARLFKEHLSSNLYETRPDLVVYSAAISDTNPERVAASQSACEVVSRAEMLGRLMDMMPGPRIAVTGAHGKTTVSSMIAQVLVEAGLDPTVFIGAELASIGGNARSGASGIVVAEACEAYDSFLSIHPDIAVITNVDVDHLDYYQTEDRIYQSYLEFVKNIRAGGTLIVCKEDSGVQRLLNHVNRTDIRILPYSQHDAEFGSVHLSVPGIHNRLNAIAAAHACVHAGADAEVIGKSLARFTGAERRFEVLGEAAGRLFVDDYAHHPAEIAATLNAARSAYPKKRIVAVFQPHLFSRTRDFFTEFAESLLHADAVIVSDIYPAREAPIPGVSSALIIREMARKDPKKTAIYAGPLSNCPALVEWVSKPNDLVFTLGAGDVRKVAEACISSAKDWTRTNSSVAPHPMPTQQIHQVATV